MPPFLNLTGYIPTPQKEREALYQELTDRQGSHRFCDLAPQLRGTARGKLSLPYKSVLKFDPTLYEREWQGTNDCNSWATIRACDSSRAVEIDIRGEPEEWVAPGATEWIYWGRGTRADAGMNPAQSIGILTKYGYLIRKNYPGFRDLSKYSAGVAAMYGDQLPQGGIEAAKDNKFRYWAKIESVEEAADALANGYGLFQGSNQIVGDRNSEGIAEYSGPCSHAQGVLGCDYTRDDPLFVGVNSWPPSWIHGGIPEWAQNDGDDFANRYLMRSKLMDWIIRNGEVFAVGDFNGFPRRQLPDYGSAAYLG